MSLGTLPLNWLISGWLSVTRFDWLSSPGVTEKNRLAFAGGPLERGNLSLAAAQIVRLYPGVLELERRRVDGKLYLSALDRAQRRPLDALGAKTDRVAESCSRLYYSCAPKNS